MNCDLFETVVLPVLPERGDPESDDLVGWRARRHRAGCADCSARAARFESALMALSMPVDLPALSSERWPRIESAAAQPAAQPRSDSARARAAARAEAGRDAEPDRLDWRVLLRAATVGLAMATVFLGFEYLRLDSDGFAFWQWIPSPLEEVRHLALDERPFHVLILLGFAACAGGIQLFLSRLFCQNGQCLS